MSCDEGRYFAPLVVRPYTRLSESSGENWNKLEVAKLLLKKNTEMKVIGTSLGVLERNIFFLWVIMFSAQGIE